MLFKHIPEYGQFYLQDPSHYDKTATANVTPEDITEIRAFAGEGILVVYVASEFSEISIEVQVYENEPLSVENSWDRVVESSLQVRSEILVLAGCPDGPEYGKFASIAVKPGHYAVKIHYGNQYSQAPDGTTDDHYLIWIWPSNPLKTRVCYLKPLS